MDSSSTDLGTSIQSGFTSMITCLDTLTRTVRQQSLHFQRLTDVLKVAATTNKQLQVKNVDVDSPEDAEVVKLNVGGELFLTSRATLTKEEDSFFWSLAHSSEWKADFNGPGFFIDRSPDAFALVIDYLRSEAPQETVSSWTAQQRRVALREAQFFRLQRLHDTVTQAPEPPLPQPALLSATSSPFSSSSSSLATTRGLCWDDTVDTPCLFTHNNGWVHIGAESRGAVWAKMPPQGTYWTDFRVIVWKHDASVELGFGFPGRGNRATWQCTNSANDQAAVYHCKADIANCVLKVKTLGKDDILELDYPPSPSKLYPFDTPLPMVVGQDCSVAICPSAKEAQPGQAHKKEEAKAQ